MLIGACCPASVMPMLNTENEQLRAELRELRQENEQLRRQIRALKLDASVDEDGGRL